jgi:xanthine/CO dehydrogenase XdhC/CoxF family maturation factor
MGWQVTVADGRAHLATPARFPAAHRVAVLNLDQPLANLSIDPDDAAVVLTHSYQQDLAILRALLPRNLAYLGVLGPRRRTAKIIDEVTAGAGLNAERAMRSIKSPVGLDLGVGSPQVIALSIIAEIQAVLSRRSASPLHLVGAAQPPIPAAVPAAVNG